MRRVEARFSASRIMVVIKRMVGKDENSKGFLINTAVIRIRIEKLSEKARLTSSSQVGSGRIHHQDGHDADRQPQIGLADEGADPGGRKIKARGSRGADVGHLNHTSFMPCLPLARLAAFVSRNGPPDHFVRLRRTVPHPTIFCSARCSPWLGMLSPESEYSRSLLRRVRIEMPRMLAAWVRLPRQWSKVSRIRSRSTSLTVRPTNPRVTAAAETTALCTDGFCGIGPAPTWVPSGRRMASGPISVPCASSTARWMVFSSSRTLPLQTWPSSKRSVWEETAR